MGNTIPSMGARDWKTKTHSCECVLAERAGFEPATGLTQHSLSRRAHSATLAPPQQCTTARLTLDIVIANQRLVVSLSNHRQHVRRVQGLYPNCKAEGVGFEPTLAFTKHVFKTCAFSRSAIPPWESDFCQRRERFYHIWLSC